MRSRGATAPIVQPGQRGAALQAGIEARTKLLRRKVQIARRQLAMTKPMAEAMMQVSKGSDGLVVAEAVMQAALSIITNCAWPDHVPELLRNSGDYLHQAADRCENQQAARPVVMQ